MVQIARDDTFTGIEYLQVVNSVHEYPTHFHDQVYTFSLMESGGYFWEKNNLNSIVSPGHIAVINPGQVHAGKPVDSHQSTYKVLYISNYYFNKIVEEIGVGPNIEFRKVLLRRNSIVSDFQNLFNSLKNNCVSLEKEANLILFLSGVLNYNYYEEKITDYCSNDQLIQIKDYLRESLSEKISLDELSKLVNLSKSHLVRAFKKTEGVTPFAYRTILKIEYAKQQLKEGLDLCEIAQNAGFHDQSHFTNAFKKYLGYTPRQYKCL